MSSGCTAPDGRGDPAVAPGSPGAARAGGWADEHPDRRGPPRAGAGRGRGEGRGPVRRGRAARADRARAARVGRQRRRARPRGRAVRDRQALAQAGGAGRAEHAAARTRRTRRTARSPPTTSSSSTSARSSRSGRPTSGAPGCSATTRSSTACATTSTGSGTRPPSTSAAHPDITGEQLYAEVVRLAEEAGWTFGGAHCGHLVGEFPHDPIDDERRHGYLTPGNDTVPAHRRRDGPGAPTGSSRCTSSTGRGVSAGSANSC